MPEDYEDLPALPFDSETIDRLRGLRYAYSLAPVALKNRVGEPWDSVRSTADVQAETDAWYAERPLANAGVYCPACIDYAGRMAPPHTPSMQCESGKRPHCSCDACF